MNSKETSKHARPARRRVQGLLRLLDRFPHHRARFPRDRHARAPGDSANHPLAGVTVTFTITVVAIGADFTVSGSISDPGADTHTLVCDFGDGTSISLDSADGLFSCSHVYAATGSFMLTVTVTDRDRP